MQQGKDVVRVVRVSRAAAVALGHGKADTASFYIDLMLGLLGVCQRGEYALSPEGYYDTKK